MVSVWAEAEGRNKTEGPDNWKTSEEPVSIHRKVRRANWEGFCLSQECVSKGPTVRSEGAKAASPYELSRPALGLSARRRNCWE